MTRNRKWNSTEYQLIVIFKCLSSLPPQIDEEVYHDQMSKIEQLLNQLTTNDMDKGNQGKVTKDDLKQGVKAIFPTVDDETLISMMKSAELELETKDEEDIDYKELFKEVKNLLFIISHKHMCILVIILYIQTI